VLQDWFIVIEFVSITSHTGLIVCLSNIHFDDNIHSDILKTSLYYYVSYKFDPFAVMLVGCVFT
jgi:hypothetical protein